MLFELFELYLKGQKHLSLTSHKLQIYLVSDDYLVITFVQS